ncbi:WD40 repeat domain-containing serine/threonine protein kinase [Micromonospora sp. NPDC003197]
MPDSQAPQRLVAGRYRLIDVLGRGGMGVVWRATDELIGRVVAVKELRAPPGLPADERALFGERALREARTAGRIHHPGVVAIHDVVPASADDDAVYIVTELVEATSLADVLNRDGALPQSRATVIAVRILDALDAAHSVGVVHRDVKPGNIMLLPGDDVKLVDFGIAQAAEESRLTRTGVMGSTEYMAPELFHGAPPSAAGDLWALGVTLLQTVNGQGPFGRESTAATIHAVLYDNLPGISCGPPLTTVITGLLTRDPGQRLRLQQARELLTTATIPRSDAAPPFDTLVHSGLAENSWEQQPTSIHPHAGRPPGHSSSWQGAPKTSYQVSAPATIRRQNGIARAILFTLIAWESGVLVVATAWPFLLAIPILIEITIFSILHPWQGKLSITEDGLAFNKSWAPKNAAANNRILPWAQVKNVVLTTIAEHSRRLTRVTLYLTSDARIASGFLHPQAGQGLIWTMGNIAADRMDVAASFSAAIPTHVAVTAVDQDADVATALTASMRYVGPRLRGVIFWILTLALVIAGTYYYLHQRPDLANLAKGSSSEVAFSPDGTVLASTDGTSGTITLWNVATRKSVAVLAGHDTSIKVVTYNHNGSLLASGDTEGKAKLWNAATHQDTATLEFPEYEGSIELIRFSPDSTTVAVLSSGGDLAAWRLAAHTDPVRINGFVEDDSRITVFRFSEDSRTLLGIDDDGTAHIWETATGRVTRTGGTFGPYATLADDTMVQIRDATSERIVSTLSGNTASVTAMAFGPGNIFATGSYDDVRIWNAVTGRELHVLDSSFPFFESVPDADALAFSGDGKTLAIGGYDGLWLWTYGADG